jgi:hypothetical protein
MAHHKRGKAVCTNGTVVRMDAVDGAVLAAIGGDVLRPELVDAVLAGVFDELTKDGVADVRRLENELATTEREMARISDAIAAAGRLEPLLIALKERQARRDDLSHRLVIARQPRVRLERDHVERRVCRKLEEWRSLLTRHTQDGRQLFREILDGPIRFWPVDGQRAFRFEGKADLSAILSGIATFGTSPSGPERFYSAQIHRIIALAA